PLSVGNSSIAWRLYAASGREASNGTTFQPCACSRPSIRVLRVFHSRSSCACIRVDTLSGWPAGCQWVLCWKGRRGTDLDPHLSDPGSYWCSTPANAHSEEKLNVKGTTKDKNHQARYSGRSALSSCRKSPCNN